MESRENGTDVVMENDLKGEDSFCSNCDVEVIKESNMKTYRLKFKFKLEGWT